MKICPFFHSFFNCLAVISLLLFGAQARVLRREGPATAGASNTDSPARRLMMMDYPLIKGKPATIGAISAPQVDAPRFVVNNFPKPSFDTQQYPRAHMAYTENQPAPLSVFAPLDIPVGSRGDLKGQTEEMELAEMKAAAKAGAGTGAMRRRSLRLTTGPKHSHKRRSRRLNTNGANPFINTGPGFFEIASTGFSKLSQSMVNPDMASMGPFVPRPTPPVPLRVRLRDAQKEAYEDNLLTLNETRIYKQETENLEKILEQEMSSLAGGFEATRSSFEISMNSLKEKALLTEKAGIEVSKTKLSGEVLKAREAHRKEVEDQVRSAYNLEQLVKDLPGGKRM